MGQFVKTPKSSKAVFKYEKCSYMTENKSNFNRHRKGKHSMKKIVPLKIYQKILLIELRGSSLKRLKRMSILKRSLIKIRNKLKLTQMISISF